MVHGTASLAKRRFHGLMRPMKLKSSVRMTSKALSDPPCMAQMTAVMSCWKRNEFSDIPCRKEIQAFAKCMETNRKEPGASKPASGYKWTTDEVNARLRKFVWAQ